MFGAQASVETALRTGPDGGRPEASSVVVHAYVSLTPAGHSESRRRSLCDASVADLGLSVRGARPAGAVAAEAEGEHKLLNARVMRCTIHPLTERIA